MMKTTRNRLNHFGVATFLLILLLAFCPPAFAAPDVVKPADTPAKALPPTLTVTLQDEELNVLPWSTRGSSRLLPSALIWMRALCRHY